MTGRLLTARNLADHLGLSPETILAWTRSGDLPGFRLPSGQLRYRQGEVEAWLEARRTASVGSRLSIHKGEEQHGR